MKKFIGIDLGTTYSAVSYLDDSGEPRIIYGESGENIIPSVVSFIDGEPIVGEEARNLLYVDDRTFGRFKRDMGTDKTYPLGDKSITPRELSAILLRHLGNIAKNFLDEVGEVVVTIPANFSNEARVDTLNAAKEAGLDLHYIINEPTAAALYYAYKNQKDYGGCFAVYDLGGGTFDVSIVRISGAEEVDVLSSNGIARLGGDDFDHALVGLVKRKYKQEYGEDLDDNEYTKIDAERDKRSLSKRSKINIRVAKKVLTVTQVEFESVISSLIAQTEMLCEATVDEADLDIDEIQGVFLVGGSTRIPLVAQNVEKTFGKPPITTANVDEVVSLGACIYAAYKAQDKSQLNKEQKQKLTQMTISESTSKCFGTIIAALDQRTDSWKLMNDVLIRKGTKIPHSTTKMFHTVRENQTSLNCKVTESTSPETDPRFVKVVWEGELELPPNRPENQEIQITYSYDESQIMHCKFLDVASGRETVVDLTQMSKSDDNENTNKTGIEDFLID